MCTLGAAPPLGRPVAGQRRGHLLQPDGRGDDGPGVDGPEHRVAGDPPPHPGPGGLIPGPYHDAAPFVPDAHGVVRFTSAQDRPCGR